MPDTVTVDNKPIVLGSGTFYVMEFTGEIPEDSVIEVESNILGLVQGGASVEYKPTYYTAKDDFGKKQKTIITDEEALMKSGICTFNGNTLAKMSSTARVTTDGNKRIVKIGGVGNDNGKKYLIRFHHEDKVDGDIRVTIVGRNEAGFSLAFAKDKETVVDAEFKAAPHDTDGTLILYEEEIKDAAAAAAANTEGGKAANAE